MIKKINKNKTVGYGYVGEWQDGSLGWCLSEFVNDSKNRRDICKVDVKNYNKGEKSYLCKITIEKVFDKNKRPIIRIIK